MTGPAIIWDVDGTLVDTAELHFSGAWAKLAAEIAKPFDARRLRRHLRDAQPGDHSFRKLFFPDADDALCAQLGARKEDLYRASVREEGTQLLPGVSAVARGVRGGRLDAGRSAWHRLRRGTSTCCSG